MTAALARDVVLHSGAHGTTVLPAGTPVEVVAVTEWVARIRFDGLAAGEAPAIVGADALRLAESVRRGR